MKKILLILLPNLLLSALLIAQAPEKFNYQGVARDNSGNILANQSIGIRITLHSGSPTGTVVYQETHAVTTNDFGFFDLYIGAGSVVSGSFGNINWGNDSYYNEVEMDATGGTVYQSMGTTQLVSVPYALYAKTSGSSSGGNTYFVLAGDISDAEAALRIENEVGPNTQFIWVLNTTQLTTVDFSGVSQLVEVNIMDNSALSSVSFPNLAKVWINFQIYNNPVFMSLTVPALTTITGAFQISGSPALTSLTAPLLTVVIGNCLLSGNSSLTSLSLPSLTATSGFNAGSNSSLTTLNVPALTTVGAIHITSDSSLTTLNFPSLVTVNYDFAVASNPLLTSLNLPSLTTVVNNFFGYNNALTSSSVNTLLARFAAITPVISGWYIRLENQTPAAPPTGQGLIDKTTLINTGNDVTTD